MNGGGCVAMAQSCEPMTKMRGSAPTAECLAQSPFLISGHTAIAEKHKPGYRY